MTKNKIHLYDQIIHFVPYFIRCIIPVALIVIIESELMFNLPNYNLTVVFYVTMLKYFVFTSTFERLYLNSQTEP